MDLWSRALVKVEGQIPFWVIYRPAKHILNRHPFSSASLRTPLPLMYSSYRIAQLLHIGNPQTFIRYSCISRVPMVVHFSYLFCRPEPHLSASYLGKGLQARLFTSATSVAEHFANHELSGFREFSSGLKAFEKGRFLESSQQFARLYELVRQMKQPRQSVGVDTQLLVRSCLAVALFRQGAYEPAEKVSKEIATQIMLDKDSIIDPLTCFEAYRAFATMVATLASFELEAQKQHRHIEEMCDSAAARKKEINRTTLPENKGTLFPLQMLKLCLGSAMRTQKAEVVPCQRRECICLWKLRILVESLANAGPPPSSNVEKKRNCLQQEVQGVLYEFLNLIESYNVFVLQIYTFLDSTVSSRRVTGKQREELTHFYLLTAEKLLTQAAAVVERLESQKQKGHPFLSFDTISGEDASAPCQQRHETGTAEVRWKTPEAGTLCGAIIEKAYAEQVVVGLVQLYRGVGSCLLRLSAKENYESQLVRFAGSVDSRDVFSVGQAALKKGLTLCKQYAEVESRKMKGGLLATLAASFRCAGDAVVSEGLFRSALNEFAAATDLQTESLIEAAERLSQSRKQAPFTAPLEPAYQQSRQDDEKRETVALNGYLLTFAERFEYASAMLQYSFLLTKWEGREFEAERLRRTAAKLFPVFSNTVLDAEGRSTLECWLFSLLWIPPVNIGLCLTASLFSSQSNKTATTKT